VKCGDLTIIFKESSSPEERFKKTILGRACFDRLRKLNPNFDEFVSQKIVTIAGDVVLEEQK